MPTPQLNLRIPPQHHNLLKTVAACLRNDAAFADQLAALVAGIAGDNTLTSTLTSIVARLEVLEALEDRVEALEREARQEGAETVAEAAGEPQKTTGALEPLEATGQAPGGPKRRRKWTEEEDAALMRIHADGGTPEDASHELSRPSSVIHGKWKRLDLPVQPRAGRKLKRRKG